MTVSVNSVVTAQGLRSAGCVVSAAKTVFNDTSNTTKLIDAGANGSVVYRVTATPRVTVTATSCLLYASPDAGVTLYPIGSVTLQAGTLSASATPTSADFGYSETNPLRLQSNWSLWVAIGTAYANGVGFYAGAEDL